MHCRLASFREIGFDAVDAVAQVGEQPTTGHRIYVRKPTDLLRTLVEAGFELVHHIRIGSLRHGILLPLQVFQMLDGHLQDVCLLQFGVTSRLY